MIHSELSQPVSLDHLERMTDCLGVIQHANYSIPDFRTGYTTDDNARALVVVVKHHRLYGDQLSRDLAYRYLAFLMYAETPRAGSTISFPMTADRLTPSAPRMPSVARSGRSVTCSPIQSRAV